MSLRRLSLFHFVVTSHSNRSHHIIEIYKIYTTPLDSQRISLSSWHNKIRVASRLEEEAGDAPHDVEHHHEGDGALGDLEGEH